MDFLVVLLTLASFGLLIWGIFTFRKLKKAGKPTQPALMGIIGGPILFVLAAVLANLAMTPERKAALEQQRQQQTAAKPAPTPVKTEAPKPVQPAQPEQEAAPAQNETAPAAEYTPAQTLAIAEGRDMNDQAIATGLSLLDDVCPENGMEVADLVMNFQRLSREKAGESLSIPESMDELYRAQDGVAAENGMTCAETGGTLITIKEGQHTNLQ